MAKAARFKVGSSGSGKHTETYGDGSGMSADRRGPDGPRIGPGVEGQRVKPDYDRGNQGAQRVGGAMKKYSEG